MKLQVALDFTDLDQALAVASTVAPHAEWLEAGTLLVKSRGMAAVSALRAHFPGHTIVADLKTADGGRKETDMAFAAGADVSTVLGLVPDRSIAECLEAATHRGRTVFVDLLGCAEPRWAELARLGASHVIYHIGKDEQGERALRSDVLHRLQEDWGFTVAVAGGITTEMARVLVPAGPAVVIVGAGVTLAADPAAAAHAIRDVLDAPALPRE